MSKDPRKDELKKLWREKEREKLLSSIPMPHQDLRDLFNYLDRSGGPPCDHTLRKTIEFIKARGLNEERIIPWLRGNGGYCDCEVFNVEDKFRDVIGK